jgi:hypothetical protein
VTSGIEFSEPWGLHWWVENRFCPLPFCGEGGK